MAASKLNIAIVGAGPAGCMLARLLTQSQAADVNVTVFESDESPNYRGQGSTLDLHPLTGLAAVREAGLYEEFCSVARVDGDFYLMSDKHLNPWIKTGPSRHGAKYSRPEIDRYDLRRILTESLPEGIVQWGHRLQSVEDDGADHGRCRLTFKDGSTAAGFDLVVGCEGTWSKVRSYLDSTARPSYSGVSHVALRIYDAASSVPEIHRLVNGGNVFAHAEGRFFALQQLGDGSIQVGMSSTAHRDDPDWTAHCGYDACDVEPAKRALIDEMKASGWSATLVDAVRQAQGVSPESPDRCDARCLYRLPEGWKWPHRRGATIIGDAAHLMLPYAGEGANQALDDARKLAAAILRATRSEHARRGQEENENGNDDRSNQLLRDELDREIREFEEDMVRRTSKVQRTTNEVTELLLFSPDVKAAFPKVILTHINSELPGFLHPLARAGIHTAWWLKNKFFS